MAETAVGFVVDYLTPLLTEEVKLLRNVHSEVEDIKNQLESIKRFLKDADMKAENEDDTVREGVKAWVKQLTQVSFRIEDVIDDHRFHLAQNRRRGGFIGSLYKRARCIITIKARHRIASQIQHIKVEVGQIENRRENYGIDSMEVGSTTTSAASWNNSRQRAIYLEEDEVVGIESPRAELIGWLLDEQVTQRTVISVVGMGGLGKTTLARKVYESVKEKFDSHAWVTVSHPYQNKELLKNIIKKFCEEKKESTPDGINEMDELTLTTKLREYLLHKRYVVIFDDVWKVDFWRDIEIALPDNKNGGRVVITTRNMKVANFCKISPSFRVHELQPLAYEKAWELFRNKLFQYDYGGQCPTYLEQLSRNIVDKCEGLPLAIVAIAGLLKTKNKTTVEWQKLHDSLSSELDNNLHLRSIVKILSLSYFDLPYHLKSCFLYFGMYPEDYSIRCSRLIRQWIAEGFVNQKKDKTLEEVALEYLFELIHRSLVQVSLVDNVGRVRTCRIHDLLHEIAVKKMESSFFCHVVDGNESTLKGEIVTRRLSIVNNSCTTVLQDADQVSQVRSILNFNNYQNQTLLNYIFIPGTLAKHFKLLKFLDFEDAPIDSIHEDIGKLFHLRYLSLRNTKVKKLPRSIGKLVNLETLDLKQSFVSEIPAEIRRLHKLRHLLGYNSDLTMHFCIAQRKGIKLKQGFGSLKSLEKLYELEVNEMGAEVIEELGKLTQLRRLGIRNLRSEHGRILGECIEKMKHLESLAVTATSEDDVIDLENMSSPPQFLQRLCLIGRLMKLPEWIKELQNLTAIYFDWSKLEDNPIQNLKNLPNLMVLWIQCDAYVGDELQFEKGMFPKMKELDLTYLSGLERVVIEEGSLVNLESLNIGPSPQLKEVPSGIQHLKNLQYLCFYDMSEEFKDSMLPEGGQHYEIVQHVPYVGISYRRDGGKYETFRLF
ncbi:disease resistance protein RPM1-like [Ziziphus jujuba]|uniref:Disease resistance protein RPM1-like n=1 Tax=Ziziphus jujuba TaxID=326968 RepID=A0ABM3I950_ZIZJJ|nr:disease resistance protein RPM1-like [Ziziphus jujuba]